jgi:hypothetical protein
MQFLIHSELRMRDYYISGFEVLPDYVRSEHSSWLAGPTCEPDEDTRDAPCTWTR